MLNPKGYQSMKMHMSPMDNLYLNSGLNIHVALSVFSKHLIFTNIITPTYA